MTEELSGLAMLRKPFAAQQIGKLPKPTKAQTEALRADYRLGARCSLCNGWHQPEVVHLDYVGHAAITDRLLDADPAWNWEPLAMTQEGLPVLDPYGGMWIKLTVAGVTRLGYGDAQGKEGPNGIKEVIGDALRNAAMRFGAGLALWHKGELHLEEEAEKMSPAVVADWLSAIETAAPDELKSIVGKAQSSAQQLKDREAWVVFRNAGKKRESA